jgi:hypothetical protein
VRFAPFSYESFTDKEFTDLQDALIAEDKKMEDSGLYEGFIL